MINNFDPDLKFIFKNPSKSLSFPDINIWTIENNLVFGIFCKLSNLLNHLTYISCHPPYTKNGISSCHSPHTNSSISLSLGKRIASIVNNDRENQLKELTEHSLERKYPHNITDYSFTK